MKAGQLNTRIAITKRVTGQGTIGQPITTWEDVAELWADVRHKSGAESIRADAVTSSVHASIRIRYRTGLTPGMRVAAGGMTYEVKAVMPDVARRKFVDLVCEAVA